VRLALIACAAAAVMGLAGTIIRSQLAAPPRMSPLTDILLLAILALALFAWKRDIRRRLEQLRAVKHALGPDGGA